MKKIKLIYSKILIDVRKDTFFLKYVYVLKVIIIFFIGTSSINTLESKPFETKETHFFPTITLYYPCEKIEAAYAPFSVSAIILR